MEGSPASLSQFRANGAEKKTKDGCGPSSVESLMSSDPSGLSSRMSGDSLREDSKRSWKNWKPSTTKPRPTSYPLVRLGRHTHGNACSLLPTLSHKAPGWRNLQIVDKHGNFPEHQHQRWYDAETERWVQKGVHHVLSFLVGVPFADGMRLSPSFAEWMMGFPEGWTELEPLEMPSSRRSRNTSGD